MEINEIKTGNNLADFLNLQRKTITHILYNRHVESYYHSFKIPKKSGGYREINAPKDELKIVQKRIANSLYEYRDYICVMENKKLNISHAFERNKNIVSNAIIHRNKRYIINIDLKDFFDSFHFGRVMGFFKNNKYFKMPKEVAIVMAQLVCYNGKLPQGAPTSPVITNFICNILDYRILQIAKKYRLDYTRYADDLTFSTNIKNWDNQFEEFIKKLEKIIKESGFQINEKKTRISYFYSKQLVTGLIVNKKINVEHIYYKKIRAMAHELYTKGKFYISEEEEYKGEKAIRKLEGCFSFINEIDKYNNKLKNNTNKKFFKLCSREKEFQKFLFYKYFYYNFNPLIITEGKTDILYIKAALKNLYEEYPDLIEKDEKGKFKFKISFFKRTNRLSFFFNISIDGADTMKNIYKFYTNSEYFNYFEYFYKIAHCKPKQPVILIFDNELNSKDKPLFKFKKVCKLKLDKYENGFNEKIIENGNLFLLTNQLVENKDESEIEDLFSKEVLEHQINGKSFSRETKFDTEKYYGKDKFSKYIYNNYNQIDFSNFRIILNNINEAVNLFKKRKIKKYMKSSNIKKLKNKKRNISILSSKV